MSGLAAPPPGNPTARDWLAVFGAVLGAFMAVLDIQITNASLPDIQGALSASIDDGSWISTGYLIAEIVMIPMTAWLAQVFGLRRYMLGSAGLFLIFSMLCGQATNLSEMVLFRIGQGFAGGVLIPLAFTIVIIKLPPAKRPVGMAMFGFSATFAPAIGPTVGGWLTDTYSWQWIFYINMLPGAVLLAAIWYGLDRQPMQLNRLWNGDWIGIALMAVGLACLEYVLEEGLRNDWFGSPLIVRLSWVAGLSLAAFVVREFLCKDPLLDLRLLGRRSFGIATLMNFSTGLGLYGTVYVLPLYLAQTQGYNAQQIGNAMMWSGLPQLPVFILMPRLLKRFDSRILCAIGVFLFGASCLINGITFGPDTAGEQLRLTQLIRAMGQPLLMATLSQMAIVGIPQSQAGSASALFNMIRNLGGSVGIAVLATMVQTREHYHFSVVAERITNNAERTAERLAMLTARGETEIQAIATLARAVRRQAEVMAYADAFYLIGAGLVVAAAGTLLLKRSAPPGPGGGGH
jgi:DHA2 family multidrug resistance protein